MSMCLRRDFLADGNGLRPLSSAMMSMMSLSYCVLCNVKIRPHRRPLALRLPLNRSSTLPLTVPSIVKRWVPWLREDRSFGGVNDLELTVFTNLTDSDHLRGVTIFEIE